MAWDEVLFELAQERKTPLARFYTWEAPAVTIGYFEGNTAPQPESSGPGECPPIRRFTGGGRVEHGSDLTFLLALPRDEAVCQWPNEERYRWIHSALALALQETGFPVQLEGSPVPQSVGPCFQNPVTWDLLDPDSGRKIGGGAQRRTRGGVIHQGSIRLPKEMRDPHAAWIDQFLGHLAESILPLPADWRHELKVKASRIEKDRYENKEWNQKR